MALARVDSERIVVDSVRTPEQLAAVRDIAETLHCHLWAPPTVLAERYLRRQQDDPAFERDPYPAVKSSQAEIRAARLTAGADLAINSEGFAAERLATSIATLVAAN